MKFSKKSKESLKKKVPKRYSGFIDCLYTDTTLVSILDYLVKKGEIDCYVDREEYNLTMYLLGECSFTI